MLAKSKENKHFGNTLTTQHCFRRQKIGIWRNECWLLSQEGRRGLFLQGVSPFLKSLPLLLRSINSRFLQIIKMSFLRIKDMNQSYCAIASFRCHRVQTDFEISTGEITCPHANLASSPTELGLHSLSFLFWCKLWANSFCFNSLVPKWILFRQAGFKNTPALGSNIT